MELSKYCIFIVNFEWNNSLKFLYLAGMSYYLLIEEKTYGIKFKVSNSEFRNEFSRYSIPHLGYFLKPNSEKAYLKNLQVKSSINKNSQPIIL